MLSQFSGNAYGTDENGSFKIVPIKNRDLIGDSIPKKFMFGVTFWFFHMVSDIAGSSSTAGSGTGLAGPLLSFAKVLSALPFFKDINVGGNRLSVVISKLFNGTLFVERDAKGKIIRESVKKFDFRTELGVYKEIGIQAIPVILNEVIVRAFYFIRHFIDEIKKNNICGLKDLRWINWNNTLPFKNRTIVRMLTIATGTFTAVDLADAAIRSAMEVGPPTTSTYWKKFVLKVNFVGIGRFAIAVGIDIGMGIKRQSLIKERMQYRSENVMLKTAKIYYLQENMWIEVIDTEKSINDMCSTAEKSIIYFVNSCGEISESIENIGGIVNEVEEKNPGLNENLKDILEWG